MKVLTIHRYSGDVDWVAKVTDDNVLIVQCCGEVREYNLEPIIKIEASKLGEYLYLEMAGGMYYSIKFEVDKFLVGEMWDCDNEHIHTFANHVFDEMDLSLN